MAPEEDDEEDVKAEVGFWRVRAILREGGGREGEREEKEGGRQEGKGRKAD
jgi:hypothetical protein